MAGLKIKQNDRLMNMRALIPNFDIAEFDKHCYCEQVVKLLSSQSYIHTYILLLTAMNS